MTEVTNCEVNSDRDLYLSNDANCKARISSPGSGSWDRSRPYHDPQDKFQLAVGLRRGLELQLSMGD